MATSANDVLVERNRNDATALESMWEEELSVPLFAVDDNTPEMRKQGTCIWTRTPLHKMKHCYDHLLYVAEDDLVVYKNSYSWAVCGELRRGHVVVSSAPPTLAGGHYMVPLEGGGSVAWKWLRPALRADLGLDPGLYVDDLSSGVPKLHRRLGMYKHVARWLAFCCLVLRKELAIQTAANCPVRVCTAAATYWEGAAASAKKTQPPPLPRPDGLACAESKHLPALGAVMLNSLHSQRTKRWTPCRPKRSWCHCQTTPKDQHQTAVARLTTVTTSEEPFPMPQILHAT